MQTLNTIRGLRDQFKIVPEITNQRLSFFILGGRRRLRSWVGVDAFDDALLSEPSQTAKAIALKEAEANLAMYHLLLTSGSIRPFAASEDQFQDFMPPSEVHALRNKFFNKAADLCAPYRKDIEAIA